jgi:hypothetical protein
MLASARAGDLSCIGVQGSSVEERVDALPSDQRAEFAPVLAKMKVYADQADSENKPAEDTQMADYNAIKTANPQATEQQVGELYAAYIRQSADGDNHYAAMLEAQYRVHLVEGQMIAAASQVPNPADDDVLKRTTDTYVSSHGADAYRNLRTSPTFEHLVAVVAASQEAQNSGRALPATAVARIGFDTASPDALAAATMTLSGDAVAAEALRQVGSLRVEHVLMEDAATTQFRAQLQQKGADSPTWRAINTEVAGGLQNLAVAAYAQQTIATALPKDPPPTDPARQAQWKTKAAEAATQAASTATLIFKTGAPQIIDALPTALSPQPESSSP